MQRPARRVRRSSARDAVQDAYISAFRRLPELRRPDAFAGWLRRIVVTVALNRRRRFRRAWLELDQAPAPPLLDAEESRWTDEQQRLLARALLTLTEGERRLCERHYYGGWSTERLAHDAGLDATAIRKRLQRVREKLRKEIEMDELRTLGKTPLPSGLPASIMELLARPRLCDLPENPVGATLTVLREAFAEFSPIELPEQLDLALRARRSSCHRQLVACRTHPAGH